MELSIRNFQGCQKADIALDGITLICGKNAQGKSGVARALSALLTGELMPAGVPKKEARKIIYREGGHSTISLADDGRRRCGVYGDGEATMDGIGPESSQMAAGLLNFTAMRADDRASYLVKALLANPTDQDLADALDVDRGIDVDEVLAEVKARGHDLAAKLYGELAKEQKGVWRHLTSDQWGSDKGGRWTPPDWTDDLSRQSIKELEDAVATASATIQQLLSDQAVGEHEINRLRNQRAQIPHYEQKIEELKNDISAHDADVGTARALLQTLPAPESVENIQPCLYCKKDLAVSRDGRLHLPSSAEPADAKEQKARAIAIGDQQRRVDDKLRALDLRRGELARMKGDLENAQKAERQLKQLEKQAKQQKDPDQAAAAHKAALSRLEMRRRYEHSRTVHARILECLKVEAVLLPTGLRASILVRALDRFNAEVLQVYCDRARWQLVVIHDNFRVTYGGRDYRLISSSEQYRVDVVLRCAFGKADGSELLVVDGAEILDNDGRGQLLQLLHHCQLPALVCMTGNPAKLPNLADERWGSTWVMEDGVASMLKGKVMA